jgi:hypothetical protein
MAALVDRAFLSAVAGRRRGSRLETGVVALVGLRFAFYGRMSTSEFQDSMTSRTWQRAVSDELVEGFARSWRSSSTKGARVGGRGRIVRLPPRCWLLPRTRIASSMLWWWGSTSARSTVISLDTLLPD